jgi:outer membrane lipoprotein SlyB
MQSHIDLCSHTNSKNTAGGTVGREEQCRKAKYVEGSSLVGSLGGASAGGYLGGVVGGAAGGWAGGETGKWAGEQFGEFLYGEVTK